jgi:acyl carrier protein
VEADVADVAGMRRAVEHAYQRFGGLHGVIHAAGIVGRDGYREIKDCDYDNCQSHFQAKVHGLHVLEEVLHGRTLDFCMLVSSLTSFLGGIGHVAYASSNIYMDAFTRLHNRSHRMPWLSVNWDLFRFQNQSAVNAGLGKTLEALGHSAEEAMTVMEVLLAARGVSQLVVSTGDLAARVNQWIKLESLNTGGPAAAASPVQSVRSPRPGSQSSDDAPRDETERQIARIWQDALGIDEIGINDGFARLGGHSLLAVRIVAELRKIFQIDLPVRALFDAPTVAELSRYIKDQIIADIEALSDEEARRLVSNE